MYIDIFIYIYIFIINTPLVLICAFVDVHSKGLTEICKKTGLTIVG